MYDKMRYCYCRFWYSLPKKNNIRHQVEFVFDAYISPFFHSAPIPFSLLPYIPKIRFRQCWTKIIKSIVIMRNNSKIKTRKHFWIIHNPQKIHNTRNLYPKLNKKKITETFWKVYLYLKLKPTSFKQKIYIYLVPFFSLCHNVTIVVNSYLILNGLSIYLCYRYYHRPDCLLCVIIVVNTYLYKNRKVLLKLYIWYGYGNYK